MLRISGLLTLLLGGWVSAAAAQDPLPQDVPVPKEPVVVPDYQPGPEESQIIIRSGDNEVYYEYRVNGELLEIKVVPEVGPSYYLVPSEGGWIREERSQTLIPSWILLRW
ncbi:DUF2782 domain-containing protein [Marinobacter sp. X15-166B]|uniref:DUF2782 domain-containing protein n=1 Tax=Marinobacter sp. X15-166B TaxID=1897620 RepID=UPI00085BCE96|nr:DUF2782 domain-containing protein [Marinobacter sp. X15-166B]OEY66485.1 hypothetical protein BG841_08465 [Marinobacter sp. X15-166B]